MSTEEIVYPLGSHILLSQDREGEILFYGDVHFAEGKWYGVQLTDGQSIGDNNGEIDGKKYFQCEPKRGLFVRANSIRRLMRDKDFEKVKRRDRLSSRSLNLSDHLKTNNQSLTDILGEEPSPEVKTQENTSTTTTSTTIVNSSDHSNNNSHNNPQSNNNTQLEIAQSKSGQKFQEQFATEMQAFTYEQMISLCPFDLVGRGSVGVDEMRNYLDDSKVMFGMIQIEVGEGQFARHKNIFVHFNGEKHPKPLQRAKENKKLHIAQEVIGHCHAPLVVTQKDLFTVEWVFEQLRGIFVTDNIKGQGKAHVSDLNSLKQDYAKRMAQAQKEAQEYGKKLLEMQKQMEEEARAKREAEAELRRKAIAEEEERRRKEREEELRRQKEAELQEKRRQQEEMARERELLIEAKRKQKEEEERLQKEKESAGGGGAAAAGKKKTKKGKKKKKKEDDWSNERPWTPERVVAAIHAETSPINWGLFYPSTKELKPLKWGLGDLSSLRAELKYDQVLYGLVRLSFGEGRFRRSHWVFFLWTPDTMVTSTPPNIRSKKNVERMKHVSWQKEMQDLLKPFGITIVSENIDKVTIGDWIGRVRKTVVVDGADQLSEEAFLKALEAEKAYFAEMKAREDEEAQKLKQQLKAEELERSEKEAERKRKEREERLRQRSLYNKAQLVKIDNGDDPKSFIEAIEEEPEEEEEEEVKNNEPIHAEEEEEEEEEEELPPPVQIDEIPAVIEVKLSEEELAKIEAERKQQEEEEKKRQERLRALEKEALMSKLIMETVELCKRVNEPLVWLLFVPRMTN